MLGRKTEQNKQNGGNYCALPFQIKRRLKLENLRPRKDRSRLLFPLCLHGAVARRCSTIRSVWTAVVIVLNDLAHVIIRLATFTAALCERRMWWWRF